MPQSPRKGTTRPPMSAGVSTATGAPGTANAVAAHHTATANQTATRYSHGIATPSLRREVGQRVSFAANGRVRVVTTSPIRVRTRLRAGIPRSQVASARPSRPADGVGALGGVCFQYSRARRYTNVV